MPDSLPRHDEEAEQAVIGCFFEDPSTFEAAKNRLPSPVDSNWFFTPGCKEIWSNLCKLTSNKEPIDDIVYFQRFKNPNKDYGNSPITAFIRNCRKLAEARTKNLDYWLGILEDCLAHRQFVDGALKSITIVENRDLSPVELGIEVTRLSQSLLSLTRNGHPTPDGPQSKSIFELMKPTIQDPTELLKDRFLSRAKGILLVGPTGVGKSALSVQCMIAWACGRPAFGITPTKPLKSLLIQAENDEGDLAEMRDGVISFLKLTPEEIEMVRENVIICDEDSRTKDALFAEVITPLLKHRRPDILWLDPAICYLGGAVGSQEDVGYFLRRLVNPAIHQFDCGCIIDHHTNKPASGREKAEWSGSDLAYLGSGSIEWANWARGILAIRSIGRYDQFDLVAAKRGSRLKWHHPVSGERVSRKRIAHSTEPGLIYWRELELDLDDPEEKDSPSRIGQSNEVKFDISKFTEIVDEPITQSDLASILKDEFGCSNSLAHRKIKQAIAKGILIWSSEQKENLKLNPYQPTL